DTDSPASARGMHQIGQIYVRAYEIDLPRATVCEGPLMASDNTSGRGMEQPPACKPFAQFLQNEHGYPERNDETPNRFSDRVRSQESISPIGIVDQQEHGDLRHHAHENQRIAKNPGSKDRSHVASAEEHV